MLHGVCRRIENAIERRPVNSAHLRAVCYATEMITKEHERRLVLFDAHAIIHRAYHALPEFATKQGEPTGGLYGLSTMLMRAIAEFAPDYMAACYDLPAPTFRHQEYKAYKATRAKTDDALKHQLERSREVFEAFHIPIYDARGFEADDMLGTIVEQLKEAPGLEILIVTGDMDTLQLVSGKRVRVYTLKKGINDTVVYDEAQVMERFGFAPLQLPDYKGLRGDPSDNIIGIAGIGEKTGSELIQKFGTIEGIYRVAKEGGAEALVAAGVKARIAGLLIAGEEEALFSKMLATIRRDAPITYVLPTEPWKDTFTPDDAVKLFTLLEFKSLAVKVKQLFAPEVATQADGLLPLPSTAPDYSTVDPILLREAGIALWLTDSEKTTPSAEDIITETGAATIEDAKAQLEAGLGKAGLSAVYEDIELPLIPIITRMETKGITLDAAYLQGLSRDYHEKLTAIESSIYEHAGEVFNINSPKQLGVVLFDKMGLKVKGLKKTEGGARSTRESELEKLRESHPIIEKILEYREIQKLLSTYIDTLPVLADASGRIHTTLHQDGTTTGRFSSTDPNLQNIPVREGLGEVIRDAFVAPKGKLLISFDYSQIEMRVLAMLSGDPGLAEIFRTGEDIHTSVAARVFGVAPDAVTKEMRRRAKVINFGIVYGMGVNALKQNLGSTREEAQEFYDQYFISFPKIAAYFEQVKADATKKGYTETMFGRRRQFPNMRSKIPFVKAMAERMAMNAPLQGTAADLVKIAMRRVDDALGKAGLSERIELILQVHDELIFEVEDNEKVIAEGVEVITKAMASAAEGSAGVHIPLLVSMKKGARWGSMK